MSLELKITPQTFGTPAHCAIKIYWLRIKSKGRRLTCTLTVHDIRDLLSSLNICPCCKRDFDFTEKTRRFPTLDRFDPDIGYEIENIIVICKQCNERKGAVERDTAKNSSSPKFDHIHKWVNETWASRSIISSFGG